MKIAVIQLTKSQIDSADWLLTCPLFYEDAESLAHNWDVSIERATEIVEAAKLAKRDGNLLTIPLDDDIKEYIVNYACQLEDMAGNEGRDELMAKFSDIRVVNCKVNATVKSISALIQKIDNLP